MDEDFTYDFIETKQDIKYAIVTHETRQIKLICAF